MNSSNQQRVSNTLDPKQNRSELEDLKLFVLILIGKWYWIVGGLLLALLAAFAFNRYAKPVYKVSTTILSKKWDRKSTSSAMDVLQGGEYFNVSKDIEREKLVIKSRPIVQEALRRLGWDVTYYRVGNVRTSELYKVGPISIELDSSSITIPYGTEVRCNIISSESYRLSTEEEQFNERFADREFSFNKPYTIDGFRFSIRLHDVNFWKQENPIIMFVINDLDQLMSEYRRKLEVSWVAEGSAVLELSTTGYIEQKEMDFLISLSNIIAEKSVDDKNIMAVNTINFVDAKLADIADSLMSLGNAIQDMKMSNIDLSAGSEQLFTNIADLEERKYQLIVSNQYLKYLDEYIKSKSDNDVIAPNTVGLESNLLDNLISKYIDLRISQKVEGEDFKKNSPLFRVEKQENQEKLQELEKSILENVNTLKTSNDFQISDINDKIKLLVNSVQELLAEERVFVDFQKVYELNEQYFNMLLSEKVEASIARASQASDYEILDEPFAGGPIRPQKNKNYLIAILLGMGIPIGIIYLLNSFNVFIVTREDLGRVSDMPVLGMIGHSRTKTELVVKNRPKSFMAESFRNLRANLKYLDTHNNENNVVLITSTMSGEGKTFCSLNLAYVIALTGKKVVLVGADMRKPSLTKIYKKLPECGLSDYLAGICAYKDINGYVEMDHLHIIHGGKVPPNPAELILSARMRELIQQLRKDFDHIIIDSPPIGMVSDALELAKIAPVTLIIVRQGKTHKAAFEHINDMFLEGKLQNAAVVFNDYDLAKLPYGYGYKYGYGYNYGYPYKNEYFDEEKNGNGWWRKFLRGGRVKG